MHCRFRGHVATQLMSLFRPSLELFSVFSAGLSTDSLVPGRLEVALVFFGGYDMLLIGHLRLRSVSVHMPSQGDR